MEQTRRIAKKAAAPLTENVTSASGAPKKASRPIISRIVTKYQTTVPPEVREVFDLKEGDLLEWTLDRVSLNLIVIPMRPQHLASLLEEDLKDGEEADVLKAEESVAF
jgi:bifunctional DNA-binding transcriptional regulator/antitoxin component of YhaV-PrlF toxin-antitoxin module